MSDRTSAAIFGRLFERLATDPTEQHKQWARELWAETSGYDFHPKQMNADRSLIVLDLAEEDGGRIVYDSSRD